MLPCGSLAREKNREFSRSLSPAALDEAQDMEKVWHIPNIRLSGNAH